MFYAHIFSGNNILFVDKKKMPCFLTRNFVISCNIDFFMQIDWIWQHIIQVYALGKNSYLNNSVDKKM